MSDPTATDLAIQAAAVARITGLVTSDEITAPMRRAAWVIDDRLGYLVDCPYCTSVWAAAAVTSGLVPRPLLRLLALSQAAVLLEKAARG